MKKRNYHLLKAKSHEVNFQKAGDTCKTIYLSHCFSSSTNSAGMMKEERNFTLTAVSQMHLTIALQFILFDFRVISEEDIDL